MTGRGAYKPRKAIPAPRTLGERIQAWRHAFRMTQRDLAIAVRVPQQSISAWEKDQKEPSGPSLEQLIRVMGIGEQALRTGEGFQIQDILNLEALPGSKSLFADPHDTDELFEARPGGFLLVLLPGGDGLLRHPHSNSQIPLGHSESMTPRLDTLPKRSRSRDRFAGFVSAPASHEIPVDELHPGCNS